MAREVREAGKSDRSELEQCLTSAFLGDPVWLWLLGESRMSETRLRQAIGPVALAHIGDRLSHITNDGNAVAIWAAPKRYRIRPRQMLPYLPGFLAGMGLGGVRRLLKLEELERLHPSEPHYYLAMLGTHAAHQGRGLAGAVLAPTLARADEEGVGCYLESSKESNVSFYRRHGFELTGQFDIDAGLGPTSYLMWRDPQPPTDR